MNSLRIEGQKTVAIEMVQQFDWEVPDAIIIPGGNLGNVSALGAGFEMMQDLGLIAAPAADRGGPGRARQPALPGLQAGLGDLRAHDRAARPRPAPSRSATRSASQKAIRILKKFDGIVEQATEDELANAAALADRCGMFNCPHTGVALAALIKLKDRGAHRVRTSAWSSSPPPTA